jgi:hypothetical protein
MLPKVRDRRLLLQLGLLVALLAVAIAAPGRAASSLAGFHGAWVRVNREADDEAREAALLQATESMSFMTRGATRLVLRRSMAPADRCEIRVEGSQVTVEREGGPTTTFDLDRPEEGITVAFEEGVLRRDWLHGEQTRGTTWWRISADGERLLVRRIIRNETVGNPTDYTTTYLRER